MRCRIMLVLGLVLFTGCESARYEVEITPQGEQFERKLTAWKNSTSGEPNIRSLDEGELKSIAQEYKKAVPEGMERKHTFRGIFSARSPNDIGGFGSYNRYESPCGTVTAYLERFRGSDDLVAEIEARGQHIDSAIDLLLGWCEAEVGKDPAFPKLREFVTTQLRRDLKNLSVYVYSLGFDFAASETAQQELGARLIQYLLERNYLPPQEVPQLVRAITELNDRENGKPLNALVLRIIARKMGAAEGEAPPAILAFLADHEKAHASLSKYLRGTDAYKKIEGRGAENKTDGEVDPIHVIEEPLARAFIPNGIFTVSDQVSLTLAVPREPFKTNGKWDKDAVRLTWNAHIEATDAKGHEIPKLFYASWAEPNATYQEDHFGRVVLDGEDLAQYCLWYRGLTPAESSEWNKFVDGLKPGENLAGQLMQFRFSHEQPAASADNIDSKAVAAPAVQLITAKLGEVKENEK